MFLLECYIETDGDYYYKPPEDFHHLYIISENLYVKNVSSLEEVNNIITEQLKAIEQVINNKYKDSLHSNNVKVLRECIESTKIENKPRSQKFIWNLGNSYGYFRVLENSISNLEEYYTNFYIMAKAIGIDDISMLFSGDFI